MSLAEGKTLIEVNESDFVDLNGAVERWEQFPASVISDHGQACCRIAREWMLSMDYSLLNAGNLLTGPRWLRQQYKWGPSSWPIYWCEAVAEKTLDCGALAALAHKVFIARGVACYRAQLIQQYSEEAAHHWNRNWQGGDATVHWIKEDLIYHEACAVVVGADEIKIWDPTASWWVNPKQFGGYGGVLLLRVFATQTQPPAHFNWGAHRIVPNQWQKIERARGDFA